jgi:hypothetical protein
VLADAVSAIENEANEREAWIRKQSGFYVQYEDQGYTMRRVDGLRHAVEIFKAALNPNEVSK